MSSKKLVLEIDKAMHYAGKPLRANLSVLDEDGSGHGHRLFGPKFDGMGGKVLKSHVLDERDRQSLWDLLTEVDGLPVLTDEAVEVAAKAGCSAVVQVEGEDPEDYLTWEESSEEDRSKMRQLARAILEAALPLLKYAVPE